MKILYGVQATGNGHISRARAMAEALKAQPQLEVQWLFSGRPAEQLFSMEIFGDYWWREGLTFVNRKGRIDQLATIVQLRLRQLIKDVRALPVEDFELIISDFEPVSAWAARKARRPSLGLGHQYAFNFPIPVPGFGWLARRIMRVFAPVQISLGMHWHHFEQPILPPIARSERAPHRGAHILAYLPFEHHRPLLQELASLPQQFIVYGMPRTFVTADNITLKAPSVEGFQRDLAGARGVICNTGFELIAEALALGKPILTRPLKGQFEQQANARALSKLKLARVVKQINARSVSEWLQASPRSIRIQWPDVAAAIVQWLADGCREESQELSFRLWSRVTAVDEL